jgi:hypothetical protein
MKLLTMFVLVGGFVGIASVYEVASQAPVNLTVTCKSDLALIREEGWLVPSVSGREIERESKISIQTTEVVSKIFRIENDLEMPFERFQCRDRSTIVITETKAAVRGLVSYSSRGKTFAIYVNYVQLGTYEDERGVKHKAYIGPLIQIGYLDEDGDGLFEKRFESFGRPTEVPKWVQARSMQKLVQHNSVD